MGFDAVCAPDGAVQHEGEERQEGADAHPQNQPEPGASWEKGNQLSPSSFALVDKLRRHELALLMQYPKNSGIVVLNLVKFLTRVNLGPHVKPDLEY